MTPSPLPTWARIAIGILAEATFLAYVFVLGRRAVPRGHTGDIDPLLLDDRVPPSLSDAAVRGDQRRRTAANGAAACGKPA